MTAIVTRGDAAHLHLPDETVDLVVTSPPYFGLRSYQDGGEHYEGQVGDEATPAEYLDALIACTAEWVRVLKPGGSIFVNLGDSYFSGKGAPGRTTVDEKSPARTARRSGGNPLDGPSFGIGRKSLVGLPWRYAIRCIDDLGLILRAEIIWSKPNGLPESVTDRVRRSHEQVFHFVKQPRYFSAVDEVREEHSPATFSRNRYARPNDHESAKNNSTLRAARDAGIEANPLGKLPGSVWTIPTAPLTVPDHLGVDHFAAYPPELVRRIVLGWSPREVCSVCGEGRRPVAERTGRLVSSRGDGLLDGWHNNQYDASRKDNGRQIRASKGPSFPKHETTVTGYACACGIGADESWTPVSSVDAAAGLSGPGTSLRRPPDISGTNGPPTRPGVVLDPFGGTGTTALVASAYGRVGISVDLSADYCRLAQWRTSDPGERARVLGVPKPEPVPEGQLGLFGT